MGDTIVAGVFSRLDRMACAVGLSRVRGIAGVAESLTFLEATDTVYAISGRAIAGKGTGLAVSVEVAAEFVGEVTIGVVGTVCIVFAVF